MVCVSGGKDSYALLDALLLLARKSPVRYELVAVNVDQGWPGYQTEAIAQHLESRGVQYRMVRAHEIAEVVERVLRPEETGATPCSLCSRLRRGVLTASPASSAPPRSRSAITSTISPRR